MITFWRNYFSNEKYRGLAATKANRNIINIGLCLAILSLIYFWSIFFIDLAFFDENKIEKYSHNHIGQLVVAKSGYLQQGFCVSREQNGMGKNRTLNACLGYSAPILFNPREMLGRPASAKIFPRFGVISLEVDGVEVLRVSDTQNQVLWEIIKFILLLLSSLALLVFAMLRQRHFVLALGGREDVV